MKTSEFFATINVADVPIGTAVKQIVNCKEILICNSGNQFFAIENKCSHADEPLACGRIRNGWISCPAHGARFDLKTGEALNPPAKTAIVTFPLRVVGDVIEVAV